MIIRRVQLQTFVDNSMGSFESRMIVHLRKCFAAHCATLSDDELRESVRRGTESAARYGISEERDVCKFIDIGMVHGPGFDQSPWAAKILNDGIYRTSTARVERLFDEALAQPASQTLASPLE
jgi:hypothetical protein